jgi:hydroxymethylpyrimidine kinase/phosphomethylpyrimidine kinase
VEAAFVARQMEAVFVDIAIRAVKTGMLGTGAVARAVARVLRNASAQNIVVDPVMRASTGARLLDGDGLGAMRSELLPLATVLTPNAAEAGALLCAPPPDSVPAMRTAAQVLRRLGPRWVLVTGGHVDGGAECVDVLAGEDGVRELRVPRVPLGDMHGSGCMLSSAIAANLALGYDVPEACARAQRHVAAAIGAAIGAGVATAGAVAPQPPMEER